MSVGNGFDLGGWDEFGGDWRFFYDCMLSPVAKQVFVLSLPTASNSNPAHVAILLNFCCVVDSNGSWHLAMTHVAGRCCFGQAATGCTVFDSNIPGQARY